MLEFWNKKFVPARTIQVESFWTLWGLWGKGTSVSSEPWRQMYRFVQQAGARMGPNFKTRSCVLNVDAGKGLTIVTWDLSPAIALALQAALPHSSHCLSCRKMCIYIYIYKGNPTYIFGGTAQHIGMLGEQKLSGTPHQSNDFFQWTYLLVPNKPRLWEGSKKTAFQKSDKFEECMLMSCSFCFWDSVWP